MGDPEAHGRYAAKLMKGHEVEARRRRVQREEAAEGRANVGDEVERQER